mmetsp:Transcript_17724/g.51036  ORF Transcript_17724/g.51036 Transcript_17724/m.51036 type:complete len:244 (-) Transcript_17724:1304-2035(-)
MPLPDALLIDRRGPVERRKHCEGQRDAAPGAQASARSRTPNRCLPDDRLRNASDRNCACRDRVDIGQSFDSLHNCRRQFTRLLRLFQCEGDVGRSRIARRGGLDLRGDLDGTCGQLDFHITHRHSDGFRNHLLHLRDEARHQVRGLHEIVICDGLHCHAELNRLLSLLRCSWRRTCWRRRRCRGWASGRCDNTPGGLGEGHLVCRDRAGPSLVFAILAVADAVKVGGPGASGARRVAWQAPAD